MKRVLVYPCGTEIGLEIYRALCDSIHYELIGGSSSYDHGRFVYKNHIDNLPFISDKSSESEIIEFNDALADYDIDYIYPAMDGVITVFSKYKSILNPTIVAPDYDTAKITRSKKYTYELFKEIIPVPNQYKIDDVGKGMVEFPIFVKPDVGQGSVGTKIIRSMNEFMTYNFNSDKELLLEYLPGEEYTIDCFTNSDGELVFCKGRTRKRIKNGISVNAIFEANPKFEEYAKLINKKIHQKGGWFFQLKKDVNGELKLLEIASRIAGTSAITRCIGVNLPLLTLNLFNGMSCDDVIVNSYNIELDRALENVYKVDLDYKTVYIDYDDTVVHNGVINTKIIKFLYQCINNGKKLVLISRHEGDLDSDLIKYRINNLFDEVIHLDRESNKYDFIDDKSSIFIDDSYGERKIVSLNKNIYVFDVNTIECLMEE